MRFGGSGPTNNLRETSQDAYAVVRALLTDRGTEDSCHSSAATEQILLESHQTKGPQFWSALVQEAEHHGVAPLIEPMITALSRKKSQIVPDDVRRSFVALASRHRLATLAREKCIDQLLAAFGTVGIPIILLKGAALAHRIYPNPELRPMVDIDVLINAADTERAVAITRGLGYSFARRHQSRFTGWIHHLPPATINHSGFQITLEIHLDAMSQYQTGSLTFGTLASRPQPFRRGCAPTGLAFGHTDMLRHLTHHAFEPARRLRLIYLYDLWRYHAIFRDEINWRELAVRFPKVLVVLRLISHFFAKPVLTDNNSVSQRIPAGVGLGMVPFSEIAAADTALIGKLSALFNPPAWWLHGFYGIPLGKSLLSCRTVRHPVTLTRWLTKRLVARIGLSAPAPPCIAAFQGNLFEELKS
jgi:Uncharacterised nucleotidyltransferase